VDERRDRSARGHTGRRQRPSLSPLVHDLCQRGFTLSRSGFD
jgi:hypothetical protein